MTHSLRILIVRPILCSLLSSRVVERHNNGETYSAMTIQTTSSILFLVLVASAALQNELHIIQLFQAATNAPTIFPVTAPLDELLFVAANLLDSTSQQQQQQQQLRLPLLILPPRRNKRRSLSVNFPELHQESRVQYDYDTLPISGTLSLTKEEQELFQLIRDVRDKHSPSTTIRVAGGWVRDKLLHETTLGDVDLVLSDISGREFAQLFRDYLEENDIPSEDIHIKKSHGARSDHLQTASLNLKDFQIDFGRLRFEKYVKGSRIPERTGVASVVEDAWRRDLTINSLFYNVNTNQVEDWTERGLQDLQLRNIATPMAALPTLLEDPLRVLRAIRFAAHLSFSMDPAMTRAAQDWRLRYALQSKVSRDNIGNEVDAMFQTRDPTRGVKLLIETDLIDIVFPLSLHTNSRILMEEEASFPIYYSGLSLLSRTQALASRIFTQGKQWDISKRRYLWYAAFFKELYDTTSTAAVRNKRGRRQGSCFLRILVDELKQPKSDIQSIEQVIKGVGTIGLFLEGQDDSAIQIILQSGVPFHEISQNDIKWQQISNLRWMCYKALKPIGALWKEALMLTLASSKQDISDSVNQYTGWVTLVEDRLELGAILHDGKSPKPLLNGSQVQERALPGARGVGFKQIMEAQEEWRIRHDMHSSTTDEKLEAGLIRYLIEKFPEFAQAER
jgi:tRNA nucleotidyltransferase/poly(A) polymerase